MTLLVWILLGEILVLLNDGNFNLFFPELEKLVLKRNAPKNDTTIGCAFLLSESGSVIDTVNTEPKLVPSHSVGSSADGSINF